MGSNRGASREIFFKKKVSQGPWLTSSPICYFFFCNNTLPKKILFLPKKKGLTRPMVNIKPNMLLFLSNYTASKNSLP
jgi:hypothetical protein